MSYPPSQMKFIESIRSYIIHVTGFYMSDAYYVHCSFYVPLRGMYNPYLGSIMGFISLDVYALFHLISYTKCLAIISSYIVLASTFEKLQSLLSAKLSYAPMRNVQTCFK